MEMYATGSSTSLTLQTPNSFRDVSFSSYLNKAEENMIRKLTNQTKDLANDRHFRSNKSEEDEELGVFGAEKYFKGEIEDVEKKNDQRLIDSYVTRSKMIQVHENIHDFDHNFPPIDQSNRRTPSVRSNASCNSRIGLLPRSKPMIEKGSKTKTKSRSFLASFGCNCIDKKSTQIQAKQITKPHAKMLDFDREMDGLPSKLTERKTRNDCFSFPVLNSNDLDSNSNSNSNSKSGNLAGKVEGDKNNNGGGGLSLTLGRKLSLLNDWDVDIPTEDEMYIPSSGMYNPDAEDSDSSSDLFEIESFSTTGNNSFIDHRRSNCYAPSEVSVDWSVVTASAVDFSVVSDYEEVRTAGDGGGGGGGWRSSGGSDDERKKRLGILSGCTSHKAVRVAGDEYKVGGGGAGARRRLSDSVFRGGIV